MQIAVWILIFICIAKTTCLAQTPPPPSSSSHAPKHGHVDDDDDDDNSYIFKESSEWWLIWSKVPNVPPKSKALNYDLVFPLSNIVSDDIPGHLSAASSLSSIDYTFIVGCGILLINLYVY
jgi:hypothetical protein